MSQLFSKKLPKLFTQNFYRNNGSSSADKRALNHSRNSTSLNIEESVELTTISKITSIESTTESDSQSILDVFASDEFCGALQDTDKVLFVKINVDGLFDRFSEDSLQELSSKCDSKSVLIFLASNSNDKFAVHWKSRKFHQFITIEHFRGEFMEEDSKIYKFIAEFLVNALSRGELGLFKKWSEYSKDNKVGAHLVADSRDYNLLLIAAESGNVAIVKILQNLGASAVADDGVTAQDLAWKNRHSEVLLALAQSNLAYPVGIDSSELSDDFRVFYRQTEELHQAIIDNNQEKVKKILKNSKKLDFYFDLSNKSAAKVAIDAKAFKIYEILLINEIFLATHEYEAGIFDSLDYKEQKVIRELHHKNSKDLPDKHINVLMANSSLSHDVPDAAGKLKHIKEVYKLLSQNSKLNTILKVVAASKKFQIIFDFNRDAVNIADPTVSDNTEGVFYPSGRIYVGAKQLLNVKTKSQSIGNLAHELCHCAVDLTYSNQANPYKSTDNKTLQKFEEINEKCHKEAGKEEVVDAVYEHYPVDMHHAELVVRPAHVIALYLEQPEKLQECQQIFPELFEFFYKVVEEMEAAIPDIERREDEKIERKDQKISGLRKKLVLSAVLSIVGIIAVAYFVHEPFYEFAGLTTSDQMKVRNGLVIYKNIEVRFSDLFVANSTAYSKLTSEHIRQIFEGHPLNFSDQHLSYLNNLVHFDWENLAGILKEKILTLNFIFQDESLKFRNLNPEVLKFLTSEQIVDILEGKELVIGKMIKNSTEFYVERKFIIENLKNYPQFLYLNILHSAEEIIDLTKHQKLFILSSEAGAGKSVTFEQLTIKIKRKFPTKWVSYVELRNHTKLYNKTASLNPNAENLLKSILDLNHKNKFELKFFEESYKTGNFVVLWNGFDEISPTFSEFFENIFGEIFTTTKNIQFVSTRPLYSNQLSSSSGFIPYELVPFNNQEQNQFLQKYFESQNVDNFKIQKFVNKTREISEKFNFYTPLMLKLIAEVHEDSELFESENFYKIYEKFVIKKVEIWQEKSEFSKKLTNSLLSGGSGFDIKKIYQKYSLLTIFSGDFMVKKLQKSSCYRSRDLSAFLTQRSVFCW